MARIRQKGRQLLDKGTGRRVIVSATRARPVPFQAVGAWADTKLSAEGAVEVRHVAEAAIEGDVEDFRRLQRQPHRRFAQARVYTEKPSAR